MPSKNSFTPEEITLCIYAARYDSDDFGGIGAIEALGFRSRSSIMMKIQNIVAMCDEEGIERYSSYKGLTGKTTGEKGRRTNWKELKISQGCSRDVHLKNCIKISKGLFSHPGELDQEEHLLEGSKHRVTVNAYERNPVARQKCIEHYGSSCFICHFDFGRVYGPDTEGFIHVHHISPISSIGKEYAIDPVRDLRPVCPNCHAVIHLGKETKSIESMKSLIKSLT